MRYLQTSYNWYMDEATFKMVQNPVGKVDIPFYNWTWENESEHMRLTGRCYQMECLTDELKFRDFTIHLVNRGRNISFTFDDYERMPNIALFETPNWTLKNGVMKLISDDFYWKMSTNLIEQHYSVIVGDFDKEFQNVQGLARPRITSELTHKYAHGMTHKQLRIMYKGRELGRSRAWVFGIWAVLFDDKMNFDTIAILNGAKGDTLSVEKFIYSVNKYVVKTIVMLG